MAMQSRVAACKVGDRVGILVTRDGHPDLLQFCKPRAHGVVTEEVDLDDAEHKLGYHMFYRVLADGATKPDLYAECELMVLIPLLEVPRALDRFISLSGPGGKAKGLVAIPLPRWRRHLESMASKIGPQREPPRRQPKRGARESREPEPQW